MIYDFKVEKSDGTQLNLADLKGKVLVIVNTATGCGFTPQYEGLEKIYEKYHDQGLEILDFPCNQFGHQAPGTDEEIHEFCTMKYQTQFSQLKKIDVNGENEIPLYGYLKEQIPHEEVFGIKNKMAMAGIRKISTTCKKESDISWNFTKFLVNRKGEVVGRYNPTFLPSDMEEDIKKLMEDK